ncbi:MAG: hypothetical protein HY322_11585 [Betaproteobacteria bacterium]|nr:hypothetical protein [Betaproteobacteria bacterium]
MTSRQYTIGLLAGVALLLGLAAATNRLVDPFWYYRDLEIEGFNAAKPRFARFERHIKPQLLARERPQAMVLGSSLAEIGFDANDPALTGAGKLKGYNFAFAGAGWDLVQCHFEYALAVTDLKRAVIGIHPGALPATDCANRMPEVREFSEVKLLVSLRVLQNSMRTVMEQRRGRSSHTREGRYLYARDIPGVAMRFREFFLGRQRSDSRCTIERVRVPPAGASPAAAAIALPRRLDLSGLRALIRAARARGIELRLFAYPYHALSLELDFLCGQDAQRWAALAAITQVVAEEAPHGGVELWEFFGYNEVTGERVVSRHPQFWQDPAHFNHEMGSLMLADMFGSQSVGRLGRRLAPGGLPGAYRDFLAGRERFLAEHPWLYDELRATLAPVR